MQLHRCAIRLIHRWLRLSVKQLSIRRTVFDRCSPKVSYHRRLEIYYLAQIYIKWFAIYIWHTISLPFADLQLLTGSNSTGMGEQLQFRTFAWSIWWKSLHCHRCTDNESTHWCGWRLVERSSYDRTRRSDDGNFWYVWYCFGTFYTGRKYYFWTKSIKLLQMAWGLTTSFGCGYTYCPTSIFGRPATLVVCQYLAM